MLNFLTLLLIVIGVRYLGKRLIHPAMPPGRLKPMAAALVGAFVLSNLLPFGPQIAGTNPLTAALGAALAFLTLGLAPFLRILVKKP
ncbi:MAG: hypothetical protein HY664_03100 [Chloroflexi bacterium]|nr:hypothetical protein [Chloroflexota bacterium]